MIGSLVHHLLEHDGEHRALAVEVPVEGSARDPALGDHVAVTYHSSPPPEGFFGVKCDVTDTEQVDAAFAAVAERLAQADALLRGVPGLRLMLAEPTLGPTLIHHCDEILAAVEETLATED